MSTMVMIAMAVVTMVIVAATIAVCKTTEEAIAVTISVSSVSSSVSSVVMIAGIVMTSTMIATVSSNVEVTHIVPGGEERSKLGIPCNPLLYFIVIFSKYFFQQIPLETSAVHILEIPWIPLMINIARIAEPSQVFMLLAQSLLRN